MNDEDFQKHLLEEEKRILRLENDLKVLSEKVGSLEAGIIDLVAAWKAAGTVLSFIKLLAGIATAFIAITAAIKLGIFKL